MGHTKVKKDAASELADKMIAALAEQRRRGPDAYPVTVARLAQLADSQTSQNVLLKAINKRKGFLDKVIIAKRLDINSPLALLDDMQTLAESCQLMVFLLRSARTPTNQAFSIAELKNKVTAGLKDAFAAAANRQIDENRLPEGIAWIFVKRTRRLFFMHDVHPGTQPSSSGLERSISRDGNSVQPGPNFPMTGTDFPEQFGIAFEKLNRQEGSVNFVSLVELRRALAAFPRPVFDAELRKLWSEGRYSLRAAEGRFGISPEERDAGFLQEGTLLLFVSRNPP
jgi:hypothetical protein